MVAGQRKTVKTGIAIGADEELDLE